MIIIIIMVANYAVHWLRASLSFQWPTAELVAGFYTLFVLKWW